MSKFEGKGSVPYAVDLDKYTPNYPILKDLDVLIDPAKMQQNLIASGVGLQKTIETIKIVTAQTLHQTKRLAQHLKADTHKQSAYHIWHFLKTQVDYKLDPLGTELIRTPARSWQDRNLGIYCEDYAIFCASLLQNMGYPSTFSVVAFNGRKNYGHIYTESKGLILDCVWRLFDEEPPRITKKMVVRWI